MSENPYCYNFLQKSEVEKKTISRTGVLDETLGKYLNLGIFQVLGKILTCTCYGVRLTGLTDK